MAKKIITMIVLFMTILTLNAEVTKEELIQALIESNQLLEESKTTITQLQTEVNLYIEQVRNFQILVTDYQTLVQEYPNLLIDLRDNFQETKTSYNDYKIAVNNQIAFLESELVKQRFLTIISLSGGGGALIGSVFDKPLEGILIGIGIGLLYQGIEYLFNLF